MIAVLLNTTAISNTQLRSPLASTSNQGWSESNGTTCTHGRIFSIALPLYTATPMNPISSHSPSLPRPNIVRLLLKYTPPLSKDTIEKKSWELIKIAIMRNDEKIFKELQDHYKNCSMAVVKKSDEETGQNVLHIAALEKKANIIRYILKDKDSAEIIYDQDNDGNTACHLAAQTGDISIFELMFDPIYSITNNEGVLPIQIFYENVKPVPTVEWMRFHGDISSLFGDHLIEPKIDKDVKSYVDSFIAVTTIVATLICTLTFTVAFSVPGGYNQDDGSPVLIGRASFISFVIFNTIAICVSITVVFLSIFAPREKVAAFVRYTRQVKRLLQLAFVALVASFGCGSYAILVHKKMWLAIFTTTLCCSTILLSFSLTNIKFLREIGLKTTLVYYYYIWMTVHRSAKDFQNEYSQAGNQHESQISDQ